MLSSLSLPASSGEPGGMKTLGGLVSGSLLLLVSTRRFLPDRISARAAFAPRFPHGLHLRFHDEHF